MKEVRVLRAWRVLFGRERRALLWRQARMHTTRIHREVLTGKRQ
jgi:hypothetical protein